jgi:hypothetical protein
MIIGEIGRKVPARIRRRTRPQRNRGKDRKNQLPEEIVERSS